MKTLLKSVLFVAGWRSAVGASEEFSESWTDVCDTPEEWLYEDQTLTALAAGDFTSTHGIDCMRGVFTNDYQYISRDFHSTEDYNLLAISLKFWLLCDVGAAYHGKVHVKNGSDDWQLLWDQNRDAMDECGDWSEAELDLAGSWMGLGTCLQNSQNYNLTCFRDVQLNVTRGDLGLDHSDAIELQFGVWPKLQSTKGWGISSLSLEVSDTTEIADGCPDFSLYYRSQQLALYDFYENPLWLEALRDTVYNQMISQLAAYQSDATARNNTNLTISDMKEYSIQSTMEFQFEMCVADKAESILAELLLILEDSEDMNDVAQKSGAMLRNLTEATDLESTAVKSQFVSDDADNDDDDDDDDSKFGLMFYVGAGMLAAALCVACCHLLCWRRAKKKYSSGKKGAKVIGKAPTKAIETGTTKTEVRGSIPPPLPAQSQGPALDTITTSQMMAQPGRLGPSGGHRESFLPPGSVPGSDVANMQDFHQAAAGGPAAGGGGDYAYDEYPAPVGGGDYAAGGGGDYAAAGGGDYAAGGGGDYAADYGGDDYHQGGYVDAGSYVSGAPVPAEAVGPAFRVDEMQGPGSNHSLRYEYHEEDAY